ncbi:LPS assembly lipoprotein LptE [Pseudodonghicola flavimaris]|uniref:LPS assembly lipoprotein LptE n=1 Tax=Pseudodonghicola flavimaris TaxID=3050036 RepID=A0ABT7EZJ4_9RHOB|nr:LPS assembly lipoprotein LptE [Pseudodonghicola flavimaris]MDK3017669.1 LPS assembly lipoprotein LptE [Pseudodonghicola flavimaris]
MSSLDRRSLLILPLALAACGFTPVYGPGGTGRALRGRVRVQEPDSPDEYMLVRTLEDRLGRPNSAPGYELRFVLSTDTEGQAVTATNETTRYSLVGRVDYTLTALDTGTVVASGDVRNFTGYSATGSTVETLAGERDAAERLMTILADQIVTRLYATPDLTA